MDDYLHKFVISITSHKLMLINALNKSIKQLSILEDLRKIIIKIGFLDDQKKLNS